MKIMVDENIPRMMVHCLRELGHEVTDLRGTQNEGEEDEVLWETAQKEERLLITTDKGFTIHRDMPHFGVLIVRLRQPNRLKIHEKVMQAITQIDPSQWPGLMMVMRDMAQSIWQFTKRQSD